MKTTKHQELVKKEIDALHAYTSSTGVVKDIRRGIYLTARYLRQNNEKIAKENSNPHIFPLICKHHCNQSDCEGCVFQLADFNTKELNFNYKGET